jgi:hypothetical protein
MKPPVAPTLAAWLPFDVLLLVGSLAACGASPAPPAQGATSDGTPAAVASSAASSAASPSAASGAPAPADAASGPPARPLELTNNCPHDLHVYYGDTPGDGKGQAATISTGAAVPVPRGADGTVVVWVTDDKGAGLASVHVTKNMRHIRVAADCSKIDADSKR